jgi:hypothetical protein
MQIEVNPVSTQCALCLNQATLVRSHIIPRFMYKEMRDAKNRILIISSDSGIRDRFSQDGIWENLLCDGCEGLIGRSEDYVCRLLYGGVQVNSVVEGQDLFLKNIDYPKLKLFLLSLLWRMSVAKFSFFDQVHLGPHEEALRLMIVNSDPGGTEDYGILCIAPFINGMPMKCTAPPEWVRQNGIRIYRCLIGGLLFCFIIGKQKLPKFAAARFPTAEGNWSIHREDVGKIDYLRDYVIKMGRAIRERDGD